MRIVGIALLVGDRILICQFGEFSQLSLGNQSGRFDMEDTYDYFNDNQAEQQPYSQSGETKQNGLVPAAPCVLGCVLTGCIIGRLVQGSFDLTEKVSEG